MKSLFLLVLVGLISFGSALDAEAGHRRCGGGHHRRGGCGNGGCYAQPTYGCQTYGQAYGGSTGGVYVDPNAAAPAAGVHGGATVDANVVPAEPVPVK